MTLQERVPCTKGACTDGGRFHEALMPFDGPLPNKVFLHHLEQRLDRKPRRRKQFYEDLMTFVGVNDTDFPLVDEDERSVERFYNICDEKFAGVRAILLQDGADAAEWIREFIRRPNVFVSSPEYFERVMESWLVDPCTSFDRRR